MRVELDLPDWVDERNIYIYAGIELIAVKGHNKDYWKIKDKRCIQCGECCTNIRNHIYPTVNGTCIHLVDEPGQPGKKRCNIALYRSRLCGNDPPSCKHITHRIVPCK